MQAMLNTMQTVTLYWPMEWINSFSIRRDLVTVDDVRRMAEVAGIDQLRREGFSTDIVTRDSAGIYIGGVQVACR